MRVQNDSNVQDLNPAESIMFDVSTLFHPSYSVDETYEYLGYIDQHLNEEVIYINLCSKFL